MVKTTSHTPTPWKQEELIIVRADNLVAAVSVEKGLTRGHMFIHGSPMDGISEGEAHANAEFITRACNSHDGLVESVKDLLRHFKNAYLTDKDSEECFKDDVKKWEAALAKATKS